MAQGPILLASASTSPDVMDKHSLRPPINGKKYNMAIQNLCFSEGNGSSSENTKGESSKTEIAEVSDNANTNENEESDLEIETVLVEEETLLILTPVPELQSGSNKKIEIARSIVYGGLTELIASLGIVTSAATTTTATSKIVGFSLASLIAGLFMMIYMISELWMNNEEPDEDEAEGRDHKEESYENRFGDRRNYHIHFPVAMTSYVAFGLVPPLVYGFAFRKREDMLLKIPTVTVVTAFCTALLGVCKAYIERASNFVEYVNIIGKCIIAAIGTSLATTVGGNLIEHYIENMGWFETDQMPILFQPAMSFQNATWGAY